MKFNHADEHYVKFNHWIKVVEFKHWINNHLLTVKVWKPCAVSIGGASCYRASFFIKKTSARHPSVTRRWVAEIRRISSIKILQGRPSSVAAINLQKSNQRTYKTIAPSGNCNGGLPAALIYATMDEQWHYRTHQWKLPLEKRVVRQEGARDGRCADHKGRQQGDV